MTSISDAIGDTAVQEIVHPRALQEPSESFLASTRRYLEAKGWTRAVAGDEDFEAACRAWGLCMCNPAGIYVWGRFGCGKTAFLRLLRPLINAHFVSLGDPDCAKCLTDDVWIRDALESNVILDDLGAESGFSDYGVKRDLVGEFIMRYYAARVGRTDSQIGSRPCRVGRTDRRQGAAPRFGRRRRLLISTNLSGEELVQRYTMRISSRIKELCIPLHLKGNDKRKWGGA